MTVTMAFLEARMGSTRLPGKVLLQIQGKSILERAVERLRAAPSLDRIAVLTTSLEEDEAVVAEARRLKVEVYRGPAFDVLARFRKAADLFIPDVIVRATADNPLIDIGSIDRIVHVLTTKNLDYCMENNLPVGAATEAFTPLALERADQRGRMPHHREHVTIYIKEHQDDFRAEFPDAPPPVRFPELRVTVDTPADFVFVENLIYKIPENGAPVPLEEYIDLLDPMRMSY